MKKVLGVALFAFAVVALVSVEGVGASDCSGPGAQSHGPAVNHGGSHGGGPVRRGGPPWSGGAPMAADACAGGVTYVDQVMTGYRAETRTRTVSRMVSRVVTREVEEAYTYTEQVPVTTPEKRTRTSYRTVTKQVPYTYT